MRGLVPVLMSNMSYLIAILIFLVVTWWLLLVTCWLLLVTLMVTGGYCLLLVVTAHYRLLLLAPTFSMNDFEDLSMQCVQEILFWV